MNARIFAALALLPLVSVANAAPPQRVVTLGGDVTEIVFALGQQDRIACDDQTSLYPPAAAKLPQVGYLRTLAAEGVIACKPELIIASKDAGPPAAVTQLKASGVAYIEVANAHTPDAVTGKIEAIAAALGVPEKGRALEASYKASLAHVTAKIATYKDKPRALFVMAQGPGGAMAAGRNSAADAMLTLAGAENVAAGFEGYKPLTPEAAIALKPDVIIVADHAVKMLGGMETFRGRPEIAMTPAGKSGRVIAMDTLLLLGFGSRTPQALSELAAALHATAR